MARGRASDLSVVLYGASGFTGRLVAHYLAARGGTGRIGLAGRCRQKLEAVAAETARVGWEPDVLVAEADDHAALSALAARTRVVLSTAGPYALCGTPLVAACLAAIGYWASRAGASTVMALYGGPLLVVNMWLILYTWLQHTDTDVPHLHDDEFT